MEGIGFLFIAYWIAAVIIFLVGLIKLIIAVSNSEPVKSGLTLMIVAIIMVIIGAGACAMMLTGINTR